MVVSSTEITGTVLTKLQATCKKSLLVGMVALLVGCGAEPPEPIANNAAKPEMTASDLIIRCIEATQDIDKCNETFKGATDFSAAQNENGETVLQYRDESGEVVQLSENEGSWTDALVPMAAGALMGAAAGAFMNRGNQQQPTATTSPAGDTKNAGQLNTSSSQQTKSSMSSLPDSTNTSSTASSTSAQRTVSSLNSGSSTSSTQQSGSASTTKTATSTKALPAPKMLSAPKSSSSIRKSSRRRRR